MPPKARPHRTNEMIQCREIRVLDQDKNQLGLMAPAIALALARDRGLDLVEIAPAANPPVCRIMDYGKFLYELHKKEHEAKKHQKQVQIKEVKFRPKISVHDYDFKMKHVKRFIEEGNKVKITIMLRGREKSKPELGYQVLRRVLGEVAGQAHQDGDTRKQDWAVSALLVPVAKAGGAAKEKEKDANHAKAENPPGGQKAAPGHRQEENPS